MSTHIHIDRLVLVNLENTGAPADYPAVFAAEFTAALRNHVRTGGHPAPPSLGPDPAASARSAAAATAHAIRSRTATAAGDTSGGGQR